MTGEDAFAALGDATRKAVFDRLRRGPQTVGALAAGLPVSRPAISQHLKVLKDAGLVSDQADGARRLYHINAPELQLLLGYLHTVLEELEAAHHLEYARQLEERRYG
jgi:DNA-binding transcriptional ArsR family regulator